MGFCWERNGPYVILRTAIMDAEKELTDAFARVVHEDFPNPGRVGRPSSDTLARFVAQPTDLEFRMFLEHARQCAPCFNDLKKLRGNTR